MEARPEAERGPPVPMLEKLVLTAGTLAIVLGGTVLLGWWADIAVFRHVMVSTPDMMPNTALMFALCGWALLVRQRPRAKKVWLELGRAASFFVIGLSAAILLEHVADADLGFDRLLAADSPRPSSHNSAVGFLAIGVALLVPPAPHRRLAALIEALALGAAALGMVTLLGYALELVFYEAPWRLPPSLSMAPHSAAGFVVLAAGVLLGRRDATFTQLLSSSGPGGQAVRRLVPVALLTIPATTLGAFLLERRDWWPSSGAAAVAGAASVVVLVLALRATARRLDAVEKERERLAADLRAALSERAEAYEREAIQRARLQSIVAQMPVGIVVVDAAGQVVLQNQASCELAKQKNPCIHDVRLPSGEPLPLESLPIMRALEGEHIASEEFLLELGNGERVPIIASASPVRSGNETVGAVTAFRDIRALKELERMREEWASIIAHDMRQPVNAISLNLDLLKRVAVSDKELGLIRRVRNSTQRLNRMIEDLLDISRIESRRLTLNAQPLRLGPTLEEALSGLPDTGENCQLDVEEPSLEVHADRIRVMQIVENLLTNAAKYGDPSMPVHVRARREHDQVVISVENRGPGISAGELQSLFERFSRTRSAQASSAGGLGLGLYICRGLVEAHGGRIWVESEPGATTAFHFTLPVAHRMESIVRVAETRAAL